MRVLGSGGDVLVDGVGSGHFLELAVGEDGAGSQAGKLGAGG
jgi:hypothetical protein